MKKLTKSQRLQKNLKVVMDKYHRDQRIQRLDKEIQDKNSTIQYLESQITNIQKTSYYDKYYKLWNEYRDLEREKYALIESINFYKNKEDQDKDLLSLKKTIKAIENRINIIYDYHKNYQQLIHHLNVVLKIKHNIKIYPKSADKDLHEALLFIKSIKNYEKTNHELISLANEINSDYKEVFKHNQKLNWKAGQTGWTERAEKTYGDIFIESINRYNDVKLRLDDIHTIISDYYFNRRLQFKSETEKKQYFRQQVLEIYNISNLNNENYEQERKSDYGRYWTKG
jgi:hypothetical protein